MGARLARLGLLLAFVLASGCGSDAPPPNVLFVTLDTTRADFLGCYGAPGNPTPALDALAARGTRFDHAVVSSALTPVSHASMFTGLHPYQHGLRVMMADGGTRIDAAAPTLAEMCAARGYATAAYSSAFPVSRHFGLERGFQAVDDMDAQVVRAQSHDGLGWDVGRGQRRADRTTRAALGFLDEVREPFLLWVHYWDPHDDKLLPPDTFQERFAARRGEDLPRAAEQYACEVSWVDRQFGLLWRALEERGLDENTIVVVIADHGEGLGDGKELHGWSGHRILYQEQMRVPCLVRVPGAPEGVVVDELVRAIDLLPTLMDLLDLPARRALAGSSLRAAIEGGATGPRWAYAEQVNRFDLNAAQLLERRPTDDLLHVVSDGAWKLHYRPSYPEQSELYHLAEDPREERNLWSTHPRERQALLEELAAHEPWVLEPIPGQGGALSPLALEILESLGYAGGGELSEQGAWEWACPADDERRASRGPCGRCGAATVPRAR